MPSFPAVPNPRSILEKLFGPTLVAVFSRSILFDIAQTLLGVVNSVLLVRFLGAEMAGRYFLLAAMFGIVPAFLNSFDQALTRFLPFTSGKERSNLLTGVFASKFYGLVGGILLFAVAWMVGLAPADHSATVLIAGAANFLVLPVLVGWAGRALTGLKDYYFQISTDLLQAVVSTVWMVVLLVALGVRRLDILLIGTAGIVAAGVAVKAIRIGRHEHGLLAKVLTTLLDPRTAVTMLFARRYRQYFLPFFVSSVSGYMKDFFPLLVVGALTQASVVAEFRIVQQLYRVAHKAVPNAFEIVRPGLLGVNADDSGAFSRRYQRFAIAYLVLTAAFAAAGVYALEPILSIWSLHASMTLYWVAAVFALELLFNAATHVEFQIFLLRDSTGYVAYMSFVRQAITGAVTVAGGILWGAVGVALGTAAGACFAWLGFVAYASRQGVRPAKLLRQTNLVVLFLACVLVLVGVSL